MILFGCNWPPPEYGEVIFFLVTPLPYKATYHGAFSYIIDVSCPVLTTWWSGDDNTSSGTWSSRIAISFLMVIRDGDTPLTAVCFFFPMPRTHLLMFSPLFCSLCLLLLTDSLVYVSTVPLENPKWDCCDSVCHSMLFALLAFPSFNSSLLKNKQTLKPFSSFQECF